MWHDTPAFYVDWMERWRVPTIWRQVIDGIKDWWAPPMLTLKYQHPYIALPKMRPTAVEAMLQAFRAAGVGR